MRLPLKLAVWLVFSPLQHKDAQEPYVRFFNDSAKAVNFYVDGQLSCAVPANPEGNLAYCDAEISDGKHQLSVKGPKISGQSCELFVRELSHAEANLSKGERFRCYTVGGVIE